MWTDAIRVGLELQRILAGLDLGLESRNSRLFELIVLAWREHKDRPNYRDMPVLPGPNPCDILTPLL